MCLLKTAAAAAAKLVFFVCLTVHPRIIISSYKFFFVAFVCVALLRIVLFNNWTTHTQRAWTKNWKEAIRKWKQYKLWRNMKCELSRKYVMFFFSSSPLVATGVLTLGCLSNVSIHQFRWFSHSLVIVVFAINYLLWITESDKTIGNQGE